MNLINRWPEFILCENQKAVEITSSGNQVLTLFGTLTPFLKHIYKID